MFYYTRDNLDSKATSKERVDKINKQFTKNLLVQVIAFILLWNLPSFIKGAIPLIEIVGWMICAYTCLLGKLLIDPNSGLNMFSLVAFPIQAWISVLNPLATLIIIHAYRKAFINLLQQNHCQTLHSSSAITPVYTIKKESNFAKTKTGPSTNWYQALKALTWSLAPDSEFIYVNQEKNQFWFKFNQHQAAE